VVEIVAIVVGCVVAVAVICCVLGTTVDCVLHIYRSVSQPVDIGSYCISSMCRASTRC